MAKAVIFARVSSSSQDYNRQIEDLKPLVIKDGYSMDEVAIIKHKESAIKNDIYNRKSISELKDLIANNPIEACYVTEISRLSRRGDVMYSVLALLEEKHISLVVQQPTLLRTYENGKPNAMAHVVIAFLSQVAQQETELKLERQKSGYKQKIKEGKVVSSKVKFGYKRVNGFAVEDKEQSKIVKQIFDEYLNDYSVTTIYDRYKHLGIFGNVMNKSGWNKVTRMLRDTTYIGQNEHFNYPRIISDEVFEKVQQKMNGNQLVKTNLMNVYYCQGLVKLNGHTMTPNGSQATYHFRDTENKKYYSLSCNVIDSLVYNQACLALTSMLEKDSSERILKAQEDIKTAQVKLSTIEDEIKALEARNSRIDFMYNIGRYTRDKYIYESEKAEEEMKHILSEKDDLNDLLIRLNTIVDKKGNGMEGVRDYYQLLDIKDDNERQRIVREAIKEVTVEYIEKGVFDIRIYHNDSTLDEDTYYRYVQKGCKLHLYCVYGDMYKDFTGTWENRVKSLDKRRREKS